MTNGAIVSSHAWSAERPSKSRNALRQVPADLSIRHQMRCNRSVLEVNKDERPRQGQGADCLRRASRAVVWKLKNDMSDLFWWSDAS